MSNSGTKCRYCEAPIKFIKTKNGKFMPCEIGYAGYVADAHGADYVLSITGDLVKCRLLDAPKKGSSVGHKPHFQKCGASRAAKHFFSRHSVSSAAAPDTAKQGDVNPFKNDAWHEEPAEQLEMDPFLSQRPTYGF